MQWTIPQYVEIMSARQERYLATKKDARFEVVQEAVDEIRSIAEQLGKEVPSDVARVLQSIIP
jgi:hypothetical protein